MASPPTGPAAPAGLESMEGLALDIIIAKAGARPAAALACASTHLRAAVAEDAVWRSFCARDLGLDAPLDPANANRYAYAGCDPINNADPTGRATDSQCATAMFWAGVGLAVMIAGYLLARFGAGWPITQFARAMVGPQAVAISTQSSLASLPAMLTSARALGVPERNSDIGLPLAVALFRATGPAMNIAVAIYVAYWLDLPLSAEAPGWARPSCAKVR